jgi:hypothetical protein
MFDCGRLAVDLNQCGDPSRLQSVPRESLDRECGRRHGREAHLIKKEAHLIKKTARRSATVVALFLISACAQKANFTLDQTGRIEADGKEGRSEVGLSVMRACLGSNPHSDGWCLGYLMGTAEGAPPGLFCVPSDTRASDVRKAFLAWAKTYPEHLSQPRILTVWAALREQWPCRNRGGQTALPPTLPQEQPSVLIRAEHSLWSEGQGPRLQGDDE